MAGYNSKPAHCHYRFHAAANAPVVRSAQDVDDVCAAVIAAASARAAYYCQSADDSSSDFHLQMDASYRSFRAGYIADRRANRAANRPNDAFYITDADGDDSRSYTF